MTNGYVPPSADAQRFSCPHCGAYAHQTWVRALAFSDIGGKPFANKEDGPVSLAENVGRTAPLMKNFAASMCASCKGVAPWHGPRLIHPTATAAPPANPDLPDACRQDYEEAAAIMAVSPRGAAALLRLAIQKLCRELGGKGENINEDIKFLVKEKGLPEPARHALDAIRVVGNNAVHPGEMNVDDTPDVVARLFAALNFVVQTTITVPKEMEALYGAIPAGAQAAADKRDGRGN